ncbi:alpha/beta hydrolase [Mesorhizobium sp. M0006]|uniref:alpha/beta fold hydrolase n=1 Tax=Mesorhizobium sp. M0006 TaxID=2956838 RepID=UPI003337ECDE
MSTTTDDLRRRMTSALQDGELLRLSPGLETAVVIAVGAEEFSLVFRDGGAFLEAEKSGELRLSASEEAWALTLSPPPPPRYHAFTAFQLANDEFSFAGDPKLWAQARSALERLFELVVACPPHAAPAVQRDLSQISGRYETIHVEGIAYDVFCEEAGQGIPVLFLHTAGADGRQYLGQLADLELAKRFRLIAVDMPFHGRSLPPRTWQGNPYKLTTELYRSWCSAILDKVVGEPAIVVGGSMGAAIAMVLAADCADKVRGIVAVEPPYRSKGRRNPYQNHVEVNGGLHNSSFVRGLMSPTSPEADRRRASWIYAQAAPGIYNGDLSFYSDEFDGELVAPRIDSARTPVALLSGTYDYSATPEDGARLAKLIPGSLFVTMDGLGHFPMCEHPDLFRGYLLQALDFILKADRH